MLKIKLLSLVLALTLALGLLAGCGSKTSSGSTTKLTDGVYKVEFDNFDSHGYKPQLEMTVSGGKITAVKYDEVDKDGKLKSQDASYKEKMLEGSKTYPEKAYGELEQQLITKQSASLDGVSGATASSDTFKTLVKYAIEQMAAKGNTAPAKVPTK